METSFVKYIIKSCIFNFIFGILDTHTSLKMMASGVASNSQSIGSGTLTATPIVPEIILETLKTYVKISNNYVTWLIVHQNGPSTSNFLLMPLQNVRFDIHLPQSSIFWNADCAYLVLGTKHLVPGSQIIR